MGFASRQVSIIRYRVRGEVQGSFWDAVHEGVKSNSFKEAQSAGDLVGIGWTAIEDFTDNLFERTPYVFGNFIALSMRIDTVRVPARILDMHFKSESRKLLEQTGQRRLSATQGRELKERLKESLTSRVFPSIQVVDLLWNTPEAVAYVGTHNPRARERIEEQFKKSFGLTLVPLIPYLRAEELLRAETERRLLENLRPSHMLP